MNQFFPPPPPTPYAQNKLYVKKGLSKPFMLIAGILSLVICAANAYIVYTVLQFDNPFNTIKNFLEQYQISLDFIDQAESAITNTKYIVAGLFGVIAFCALLLSLGFLISFFSSLNKNSESSPGVGIGFLTAGAVIDIILKLAVLALSILLVVGVIDAMNKANAFSDQNAQITLYTTIGIAVYAFFLFLFACSIASFASSARKTLKEKGKFKKGIGMNSFCTVILSLVDIAAAALLIMFTVKLNRPISDITTPLVVLGGLMLFRLSICFAMLGYGSEIANLMGVMPVEAPFPAPEGEIPPEESASTAPPTPVTNYPEATFDPNTAVTEPVNVPQAAPEAEKTSAFDPEATVVLQEAPKLTETCPICGNENYIGSKFCEHCGSNIAKDEPSVSEAEKTSAFDPEATVVLKEAPKLTETCPICGNENYIGSKFCEHCGSSIVKDEPPQTAPETAAAQPEPEHIPTEPVMNPVSIKKTKPAPQSQATESAPSEPVIHPVSIKKPEPVPQIQPPVSMPETVSEPEQAAVASVADTISETPAAPVISETPLTPTENPNEKVCPNCGTANPLSGLFCKKCGVMLNKARPKPVQTPQSTVQTNCLCSNCGTENSAQSKFCKKCGNKLK